MKNKNVSEEHSESLGCYNAILWIVGLLCLTLFIISFGFFLIRGWSAGWSLSESPRDYLEFGAFAGALLTPLVAAASLLLFWKTLRFQMTEFRGIVNQNNRLFQLKVLHERLPRDFTALEKLKTLQIEQVDAEGDVILGRTGGSVLHYTPFVELSNESQTLKYKLANIEQSETQLVHWLDYLHKVLIFGSDVLKYKELGGAVHHFPQEIAELRKFTSPFFEMRDDLPEMFESPEIRQKLKALSSLDEKLSMVSTEVDESISRLLFSKG